MKQTTKTSRTWLRLGLICSICLGLALSFSSCKKDDDTGNSGGGGGGGTTDTDYILFDGVRVDIKNPSIGEIDVADEYDTTYQWYGNKPTGIGGDTGLFIGHIADGIGRAEGKSYKLVEFASNTGEVHAWVKWGAAPRPFVRITSGTYSIKKVDGKWVSTMKNGSGEFKSSSGNTFKYDNIEFRATWPE